MKKDLRAHCHTIIAGNHEQSPAEHFYAMAKWCEEHQVKHDVYGDGEFINSFQQKVADLLGFEAGLFVITGTMTQATALELVCRKKRNPVVAMHESSHIYRFERQGYQLQNRFPSCLWAICSDLGQQKISTPGQMKFQRSCMSCQCVS